MMKGNGRILFLCFLFAFCFSGCDFLFNTGKGFIFDEEKFNAESKAWENINIKNYSFVLKGKLPYWNFSRAIKMYNYEVKVIVKNGAMESFEYIGENPPRQDRDSDEIMEPEYTSISDMYQKIYAMAQDEKQWWKENTGDKHILSTKFEIKYDKNSHYITFFEPVSRWKPDVIVDTTAHAVTVSDFTILDAD
jgi:hypothetical protein